MKHITTHLIIACLGSLFAASASFAQMYTITDLGEYDPTAINLVGQVSGYLNGRAYVWTQADGFQDLGTLVGGTFSKAYGINNLGAVTGSADGTAMDGPWECNPIQPFIWNQGEGMEGLGVVRATDISNFQFPCIDSGFYGTGINDRGQVIGYTRDLVDDYQWGFVWTSDTGIRLLGNSWPGSCAHAISNTGQIVGETDGGHAVYWKNGAETRLVSLNGDVPPLQVHAAANGVNDRGQIVGWSAMSPTINADRCFGCQRHAVLWTADGVINDLGTLPSDTLSDASRINLFGQAIGSSGNASSGAACLGQPEDTLHVVGRPYIWSEPTGMKDLNTLIGAGSGWVLNGASDINGSGQIVGKGALNGEPHGFLLTPIYQAQVQPPIDADDSSVFKIARGVIAVKFTLTNSGISTCGLPPATIAVSRIEGGKVGLVDTSSYLTPANGGSDFRIDPANCNYVYDLAASSLGTGTYMVDINIDGIAVGHAVFGLN